MKLMLDNIASDSQAHGVRICVEKTGRTSQVNKVNKISMLEETPHLGVTKLGPSLHW